MAKKAKTAPVNKAKQVPPNVPVEAVPHLFNAQMLRWQKANFEALKAIHEELVKLNKKKVK